MVATIKDVAKLAEVNISTVSRVLSGRKNVSDATKERVMEAIRHLDYQPNLLAQGLKGGRTSTAALVIPNIRNSIFPAVSRGAEDCAVRLGYNLILCNTDEEPEREKDYIEMLQKRFVDGAIFATATDDSDYLLELAGSGFPMVSLMRELHGSVDTVVAENVESAYKATAYLLEKGCLRVAFLNGSEKISLYRDRFAGYRRSLEDYGVPFDPDIVQEVDTHRDYHSGYHATEALLAKGRQIDGIFSSNDNAAIGAIACLRDRGLRVPEDVKVLGFGNLEISQMTTPSLSTINQPLYKMGEAAMEMLFDRIQNPRAEARKVVFQAELLVRESA